MPSPIHLTVTIDGETVTTIFDLLVRAVEQGTSRSKATDKSTGSEPQRPKMTPLEASRHAHFGGKRPPEDMGLLVDTHQACKLLGVSSRKLWQMYNSGQMPKPTRIGRAVRWSYEELRSWVNAGCPPDSEWKWPVE